MVAPLGILQQLSTGLLCPAAGPSPAFWRTHSGSSKISMVVLAATRRRSSMGPLSPAAGSSPPFWRTRSGSSKISMVAHRLPPEQASFQPQRRELSSSTTGLGTTRMPQGTTARSTAGRSGSPPARPFLVTPYSPPFRRRWSAMANADCHKGSSSTTGLDTTRTPPGTTARSTAGRSGSPPARPFLVTLYSPSFPPRWSATASARSTPAFSSAPELATTQTQWRTTVALRAGHSGSPQEDRGQAHRHSRRSRTR